MSVFTRVGNTDFLTKPGHAVYGGDGEVRPMSPSSSFDIFPVVPYEPGVPPENWQDARQWLDDELQRLAAVLRNKLQDRGAWILYGDATSVPMNTTPSLISGYEFSGFWGGGQPSQVDPVAGTIMIPDPGIYRLTAMVTGNASTPVQNEIAALDVDIDGVPAAIAGWEKASQKNAPLAFSGGATRAFNGGEVISLYIEATANFGTFDFVSTSFEVEKLVDVPT